MVANRKFRELTLSIPDSIELPHHEKTSFRLNKKIFATLDETKRIATLKFSEIDQSVFCSYDKLIIYPVPNKWGKQGWTYIALDKVPNELVQDALNVASREISK